MKLERHNIMTQLKDIGTSIPNIMGITYLKKMWCTKNINWWTIYVANGSKVVKCGSNVEQFLVFLKFNVTTLITFIARGELMWKKV